MEAPAPAPEEPTVGGLELVGNFPLVEELLLRDRVAEAQLQLRRELRAPAVRQTRQEVGRWHEQRLVAERPRRRQPGLQIRIGVEFKFRTYLNCRTYTVP